jgi:hypothetical protein
LRPLQIYPLTISLSPLPALKTGCLGAFMLIVSPAPGLRPSLGFASVTPNVPKPSKRVLIAYLKRCSTSPRKDASTNSTSAELRLFRVLVFLVDESATYFQFDTLSFSIGF